MTNKNVYKYKMTKQIMEKGICPQCGREFEKAINNQKYCLREGCTPLPKLNMSKEERVRMYKRRWKEKNRLHNILYSRKHRQIPEIKEETRIYRRKWDKDNRGIRREIEIRYKIKYPEKKIAHQEARHKAKMKSNCEYCGETEGLHKHHEDYSKPLEVVTLCNDCHHKLHRGIISLKEIIHNG